MQVSISSELLVQAKEHARSQDELAAFLKQAGLSKSLSVIAFAHVADISLSAAKQAIHTSRAWAESRVRDEHLHSHLIRALG